MKKLIICISTFLVLIIGVVSTSVFSINAATPNNRVIYFHSETCGSCRALKGIQLDNSYLEEDDYIKKITDAGIEIIYFDVDNDIIESDIPENVLYDSDDLPSVNDLWKSFATFYNVSDSKRHTPHMFVGDTDYSYDEIIEAFNNGEFVENAKLDFLSVDVDAGQSYNELKSVLGYITVLGAGLLDGFNPCAIALLLMFISLLGFTDNKKILAIVSATYIITMFVSYLLIGLGVLSALRFSVQSTGFGLVVSWIILIIVLIFFVLNTYDFFVTRKQEYGKIKSQIPKWLQRFNSRIMKTFTNALSDETNKGNIAKVVLLTFVLGIVMTLTEFTCSGGVYLGILDGIKYFDDFYAYFALISFNVMFVAPMIVIAVIAIKSKSIMSISNWIREHLHIIKLLNALLFLFLAVYFSLRIAGVL